MKKRINLFTTKKVQKAPTWKKQLNYALTACGVLLFIGFIVVIFLDYQTETTRNQLLSDKATAVKYISDNRKVQANFGLFAQKKDQIKKYLKDDAEFLAYYKILKESIDISGTGVTLQNLTLDNAKVAEFSVNCDTVDTAYAFIKYIESDMFLENFDYLTLNNLGLVDTITNVSNEKSKYVVSLKGKFKIKPNANLSQ